MRPISILFPMFVFACTAQENETTFKSNQLAPSPFESLTYAQLKEYVHEKKNILFRENSDLSVPGNLLLMRNFWVDTLFEEYYLRWAKTPWLFSGTSQEPKKGAIACGYFVTTLLRDMDVKLQRIKLAECASSEMMQALVPGQKIKKLNHLSNEAFNRKITEYGKGVYIIGLDFHTGFIINDGKENWFLHSNYINSEGVIKEKILTSQALLSSNTRWIVSLTSDVGFLERWLNNL